MTLKTTVLAAGLGFPEGPRWRDEKLWFSDHRTKKVMAVDLQGRVETIAEVPTQPSGLGWLPDGSLLVVSMTDRRLLRWQNNHLIPFADLSTLASFHCNDMVVDQRGNAYVGNFGSALFEGPLKLAEIILVNAQGEARVVAQDMAFPNGSVITPDGKTLIVAETLAARLSAFTINTDGSLSQRRVWAQFDDRGVVDNPRDLAGRIAPDGICLDAEGAIWLASPNANSEVLRVLPGGQITQRIQVETVPYACMLGGPDRRTLFVLTSRLRSTENIGRIETVRVEVPGAGLP